MSLVIGSVYADAVNSKLGTALKMKDIATDYTDMVSEILVFGDEVHFPTFNRLTDAEEVTKGTPLTPEEIGMSDSTAKVKQTGKSVRIYDKDKAQIKGAVVDAMSSQTAEVMAKKIDSDLIKEMADNAVYKTALPGELTVAAIDSNFCTGDLKDKSEYCLDDPKGADILFFRRKSADDPFDQQDGDGQDQVSDHNNTDEDKSYHSLIPFRALYNADAHI